MKDRGHINKVEMKSNQGILAEALKKALEKK